MVTSKTTENDEPAWISTAKAEFERGISDWNRYLAAGPEDFMRVVWGPKDAEIDIPHVYPQALFDWAGKNYEVILFQNGREEPQCLVLAQLATWRKLAKPLWLPTSQVSQLYNALECVAPNVRIGLLAAPDRERIKVLDIRGVHSLTPPSKADDLAYLAESISASVDALCDRLLYDVGFDHWSK